MINGWDKILGAFAVPLVWVGSMEWRMRGKVGKDRFEDLQKYLDTRFNTLEKMIDDKEEKDV